MLTSREVDFAASIVRYLDEHWMNGQYPWPSWNVFEHRGDRTNNRAENSRTITENIPTQACSDTPPRQRAINLNPNSIFGERLKCKKKKRTATSTLFANSENSV